MGLSERCFYWLIINFTPLMENESKYAFHVCLSFTLFYSFVWHHHHLSHQISPLFSQCNWINLQPVPMIITAYNGLSERFLFYICHTKSSLITYSTSQCSVSFRSIKVELKILLLFAYLLPNSNLSFYVLPHSFYTIN